MFLSKYATGFYSFFRGFKALNKNKLWAYVLLPSFLSFLIGTGILYFSYQYFSSYLSENFIKLNSYLPSLLQFGNTKTTLILAKVFALLFSFFIYVILYSHLASLMIIPFIGPLLTRLENIYLGKSIEIPLSKDIKNAFLGILSSLKYLPLSILGLLFSLFLGPFQIVFMIFWEGYFLGKGSFEYMLEKDTETLKERSEKRKGHRTQMWGLGSAQFIFLMIPVIGIVLSPCTAMAGAFLLYHDIHES